MDTFSCEKCVVLEEEVRRLREEVLKLRLVIKGETFLDETDSFLSKKLQNNESTWSRRIGKRSLDQPTTAAAVKKEMNSPGSVGSAAEDTTSSLSAEVAATEIKVETEAATSEDHGILQNGAPTYTWKPFQQKEDEWTLQDFLAPINDDADDTGGQPAASSAPSSSQCVQIYVPAVRSLPESSTLNEEKEQRPEPKRPREKRKRNICPTVVESELKRQNKNIKICHVVSTPTQTKYNLRKRTGCDYLKLNESGEKAYKCRTCSKSLPTQAALKSHILDHARKNRYKCAVCKKYFAFFRTLKYHEFSHRRGKVYQCSVCKKSSDGRIGLKGYLVLHSACQKIRMKKLMVTCTDKTQVQCDVCFKYLANTHTLRNHMYIHTEHKGFQCPVCNRLFRTKEMRQAHMNTHTGPKYQCSICGKLLRALKSLKQHMFAHTGEKPFHCTLCSSSFAQKANLKLHMCTHTGEKLTRCRLCPQRFASSKRLKYHMVTHTGVRPFPCGSCTKSFVTMPDLNRHLRVHTGEKPFKCSQCASSFTQPNNLKVHMLVHTGEKPHLCTVCGRSLTTKQSLQQHMRTHTKKVDKHPP